MTTLTFPSTLPAPSVTRTTPNERRLVSSDTTGMPQVRVIQREFVGQQELQWEFTGDQMVIWNEFWDATLLQGGRWFVATWPQISADTVTCRFNTSPQLKYLGNDYWQVVMKAEILRTKTPVPVPPVADVTPPVRDYDVYVNAAFRLLDNSLVVITGDTVSRQLAGYGPYNESDSTIQLTLRLHGTTTTVPSGPNVTFAVTHIKPLDQSFAAYDTASSTTNRSFLVQLENETVGETILSKYVRFRESLITLIAISVNGTLVATTHIGTTPDDTSGFVNKTTYSSLFASVHTEYPE